jgi:hypothetical protein
MSRTVRRAAGAALVVAACGTAAASLLAERGGGPASGLARRAEARQRELKALEGRASDAAASPALRAALAAPASDGGLLATLDGAAWWRPIGQQFKAVRLVSEARVLAEQGGQAGQAGIDLGNADRDLVAVARSNRAASAVLWVGGRPLLAAAARVPSAEAGEAGGDLVLVLGNPVEAAMSAGKGAEPARGQAWAAWLLASILAVAGMLLPFVGRRRGPGKTPRRAAATEAEAALSFGTHASARLAAPAAGRGPAKM